MNNLKLAKSTLFENEYSIVVVKENEIVYKSESKGLQSLISLYKNDVNTLENSSIADKVIGRAAALILVDSNIKEVYADLISQNAIDILDKSNIPYEYKAQVKEIRNRDNTGMCPMEELSLKCVSADELIEKIEEKFNKWIQKN